MIYTRFIRLFRRRAALQSALPIEPLQSKFPSESYLRMFAEICTGLWRLRQKNAGADNSAENRRVNRQLEAMWDTLQQGGFEIVDLTNTPYQAGMALQVIAFQPTAGVGRDTIIEVIRPLIYLHKRVIQMSEVIVGTPEIATSENPPRAGDSAPKTEASDQPSGEEH